VEAAVPDLKLTHLVAMAVPIPEVVVVVAVTIILQTKAGTADPAL
jgi:hypothetical protein